MKVTYLFDPLCGWCYGASPAIDALAAMDDVTLEFAPSGLFAGQNARPIDASSADFFWQNDVRIARISGQSFTEAYRENVLGASGAMLDSAPATLALVAVGLTEPARERDALKAIQLARYSEGRNNAEMDVIVAVLEELGLAEAAKRLRTPDEELLAAYRERVNAARQEMARFGANGVPALIVGEGNNRRMVNSSALYGGVDQLKAALKAA